MSSLEPLISGAPTGVAGDRMVVERPPEGVGRGILPVPPALVVVVSAAIVSAVIFHLLLRARRR